MATLLGVAVRYGGWGWSNGSPGFPAPPPRSTTAPPEPKVCVNLQLDADALWDVFQDDGRQLGDDPIFFDTMNSGQGHNSHSVANRHNGPGGADPDDLVYGHLYRHRAPIPCGPADRVRDGERQIYRLAGTPCAPPHRPFPEPESIMRHGGPRWDG